MRSTIPVIAAVLFLAACDAAPLVEEEPSAVKTTTSESTTTSTSLTTTTESSTATSEPDPNQADLVTAAPIELPSEVLDASEGLILGVGEEFLFPDGASGLRDIVVRVEGGAAVALRGRWCGNFFGPPHLDDFMGGAVVGLDEGGTIRCTPGQQTLRVSPQGFPLETALIEDRPHVALRIATPGEARLDLVDLQTTQATTLLAYDPDREYPAAASRSDDGTWVVSLIDVTSTSTRHVLVDDSGDSGHFGSGIPDLAGRGLAAVSPDGSRLAALTGANDLPATLVVYDLTNETETSLDVAIENSESVSSIRMSDDLVLLNVDASDEETHPLHFVLIDLTTGESTVVGGRFDPLEIRNASFVRP